MKKRNCCFRQFKVHHVQLSGNGKTLLESDRTMNFVVIVLVMEVYSDFKKWLCAQRVLNFFFRHTLSVYLQSLTPSLNGS